MKSTLLTAAIAAMFAVTGCTDNTKTSGGPGGKDKDKANTSTVKKIEDKLVQRENSFSLNPGNVTLKQGETKKDKITIKRGKGFDQDVALSFDKLPDGVTIDPAAPVVKKGDDSIEVTFKAGDAAAITKTDVKMTGKPTTGDSSNNTITVNVEKK